MARGLAYETAEIDGAGGGAENAENADGRGPGGHGGPVTRPEGRVPKPPQFPGPRPPTISVSPRPPASENASGRGAGVRAEREGGYESESASVAM